MIVLVIAFMLIFNLFHATLRYSGVVEKRVFASVIAGRKMEEVRQWAREKTETLYNFDSDWSAYSGVTSTDPENPEFTVLVNVREAQIFSPSSVLEEIYNPPNFPTDQRRKLGNSLKKVKVTVFWNPADLTKQFSMVSYIKEPSHPFPPDNPCPVFPSSTLVTLTPEAAIPVPLAKNGTVTFTVSVSDNDGTALKDLFFRWYVQPKTGNGTITQSRDGRSATFMNRTVKPDGSFTYTGGICVVVVRAMYRGGEQWGGSDNINLAGP